MGDEAGPSDPLTRPRRASGGNAVLSISARVDYGVHVLCVLAHAGRPMTTRQLSASQGLPLKYLEAILTDLRRSGILTNERGPAGGFRLARSPDEISLHEAVEPLVGSLVEIRGRSPEATEYGGSAEGLQSVWMTLRAHLRAALERVTIADIVASTVSTAGDPAVGSGAALPTGSR